MAIELPANVKMGTVVLLTGAERVKSGEVRAPEVFLKSTGGDLRRPTEHRAVTPAQENVQ
jgi:hypothetical protein